MNKIIKTGKLELIIGPMFSGKSSKLIKKIRIFQSINKKILIIKPKIDNRYELNKIASHDNVVEDCLTVTHLNEININIIKKYETIIIDEGQLFTDLKSNILIWVEELNIHVIVAGLDGDYKREPIGEILNLIPYADKCTKLYAMCNICNDETPGIFTHRKILCNEKILIGGSELYQSLCRTHYTKLNCSIQESVLIN